MKQPTVETFELNGRRLKVSVRLSERARKTISFRFETEEELVVTLPMGKGVDIGSFLLKHRRSLSKRYEAYLSKQRILQDDTILFKGKPYRVKVKRTESHCNAPVILEGESIIICAVGRGHPVLLLKQWLIEETRELVRGVVAKYSGSLGMNPERVSVRDTSRWGYCKGNGKIVYNWQILALPPRLAEYVILHEIVHLSEFNHQRGFYSRLGNIIPDYKQRQQDLKRYSLVDSIFELSSHISQATQDA